MNYLLSVFPGLQDLASEELQARLKLPVVSSARCRGSELLWVQTSEAKPLFELRLIEDVLLTFDKLELTGQPTDLGVLSKMLATSDGVLAAAKVYAQLRGQPLSRRMNFRVVVQADDARWRRYRRVDLQTAAESGVMRGRSNWRLHIEAPVEIWLHQVGRHLYLSLRLTTGLHRSRGGRTVERGAALRPTIAAAMVWLSNPQPDDVFLDPMCGTGTILLERATAGRYGLLLGGDIDREAVKATRENFGPRHKPRRIESMDARRLPLEDASVDRFVTNLPWGRQIGKVEELPALYKAVLVEAVRVMRPGGVAVFLSSEWEPLRRMINHTQGLKLERTVTNIEVLGRRADMAMVRRV